MKTIHKLLLLMVILTFPLSCDEENDKVEVPQWLDEMIQEMEDDPFYFDASVYRYRWNESFIYEFEIPISSCLYCKVYTEVGELINWEEYSSEDFLEQRTDKKLIWHNPNTFD